MNRQAIVRDYCKRFPKHGNLTLAKAIYDKFSEVFTTLESVRSSVRQVRGVLGEKNRRTGVLNKSLYREPGYAGQPPLELPRSIAKPWEPFHVETRRNVILSDIHIPFHDDEALSLAIAEAESYRPDGIILNGDIVDFFAVSRWEKPHKRPRGNDDAREADNDVEYRLFVQSQPRLHGFE
jgi:hypothetical protein